MRVPKALVLWAAAAAAPLALAQSPTAPAPDGAASAPGADFARQCAALPMTPVDGLELAQRARCVLAGVLPSTRRHAEARELARKARGLGEPAGGLALYLAYATDPANTALRDGKVDPQRYEALTKRPMDQRRDQVEAIEGLAFAADKGNPEALLFLARYFYETPGPLSVARLRAMTTTLLRNRMGNAWVERVAREAETIDRVAPGTKASARSFLDAYRPASEAALAAYPAGAGSCEEKPALKAVTGPDRIPHAVYLPLREHLVKDSFLLKGEWTEQWDFTACGRELPVKVTFTVDGAGGARSTVAPVPGR